MLNWFKKKEYFISFHFVNKTDSGFGNTFYSGQLKNSSDLRNVESIISSSLNNGSTISIIFFTRIK